MANVGTYTGLVIAVIISAGILFRIKKEVKGGTQVYDGVTRPEEFEARRFAEDNRKLESGEQSVSTGEAEPSARKSKGDKQINSKRNNQPLTRIQRIKEVLRGRHR